jgi:hypothetical protein
MLQNRRRELAGMENPSCGMSRSRNVRMKSPPRRPPAATAAHERGNPPRAQALQAGLADLVEGKARERVVRNSAGQRLRRLPQEVRRRAPEHEKARRGPGSIDQHAEHRKEPRPSLDLVEHHEAPEALEGQERVESRARSSGLSRSK